MPSAGCRRGPRQPAAHGGGRSLRRFERSGARPARRAAVRVRLDELLAAIPEAEVRDACLHEVRSSGLVGSSQTPRSPLNRLHPACPAGAPVVWNTPSCVQKPHIPGTDRHLNLGFHHEPKLQDRRGRASLDPLLRGRPRAAPVHARARPRNAIAKGVRKTGSRFGARLEPLTRSALILHEGRGELHTVSGADIISSHEAVRADGYALAVGLIGAEAVAQAVRRARARSRAPTRAAAASWSCSAGPLERAADPQHDGLGLAFQLKLLALAGYLPHLVSCAACGSAGPLVGFSPAAGGAVCAVCLTTAGGFPLSQGRIGAIESMLDRPLQPVALAGRRRRRRAAGGAGDLRPLRRVSAAHAQLSVNSSCTFWPATRTAHR